MRYLLTGFFIFLSLHSYFVFGQDAPLPQCTGLVGSPNACGFNPSQGGSILSQRIATCVNAGNKLVSDGVCAENTAGRGSPKYNCYTTCQCPPPSSVYIDPVTKAMSCEPPPPDEQCPDGSIKPAGGECPCVAPQVEYAGFCRDAEDSPPDCGDTYTTAVFVDGRYVCSNDESCGDGSTPTIFTNAQGSWKVCGSGDDGNSSEPSGGSSSPAASSPNTNSSAPSTGGDDDNGSGTGSGGGSGTGDGSGNGSGSAASSSSPSGGSGSASSGIGNGGEADASKCENGEPHCDGDPIQCAILVQLWINNCTGYDDVETNNPDDDNDAIQSNFDALMSSAEPSVNAEGILDAMTPNGGNGNGTGSGSGSGTGSGGGLDLSGLGDAAGSGGGGSCPPDRSIGLGLGNFNISYQFLCDFAAQISGLVILIFSYIGSIIIYRSLNW